MWLLINSNKISYVTTGHLKEGKLLPIKESFFLNLYLHRLYTPNCFKGWHLGPWWSAVWEACTPYSNVQVPTSISNPTLECSREWRQPWAEFLSLMQSTWLDSYLLAHFWPSPIHHQHLGRQPVDRSFVSLPLKFVKINVQKETEIN